VTRERRGLPRRLRGSAIAFVLATALTGCGRGARDGDPADPATAAASRPAAPADPASRETLDRIVRAESTIAYSGWRTVSQGPRGESRETRLRVVRSAAGPTLLEWHGDDRRPEGPRRWTVDCRFPWIGRPELLLRNYRVVLEAAPGEPVAWRETRRVRFEPRLAEPAGRATLHLLVDAETWLVLAESTRGADGREWRSARFESIEYGAASHDSTDAASGPGPSEPLEPPSPDRRVPDGFQPRAVVGLPEGFERVEAARSPCGAWREDFSDGLAGFSVLQAPADPDAPPVGEVRRRTWLGGAALTARVGELTVTVTGSLSADDLLHVLRNLGGTDVTPP
jgi:hypothetical protein